jgi:hypothetical protein
MSFKFHFTFDDGESKVTCTAGRTSLWKAQDYGMAIMKDHAGSRGGRQDFAWGYFAAKDAGILEQLGITDSMDIDQAVDHLADSYDLTIDDKKDSSPLPQEAAS